MTISKKQLQEAGNIGFKAGYAQGIVAGKTEAKHELLTQRQSGIVEISRAVADLAMANAKLTYAMSRITDKLL